MTMITLTLVKKSVMKKLKNYRVIILTVKQKVLLLLKIFFKRHTEEGERKVARTVLSSS